MQFIQLQENCTTLVHNHKRTSLKTTSNITVFCQQSRQCYHNNSKHNITRQINKFTNMKQ